jgi:hypothetical protein
MPGLVPSEAHKINLLCRRIQYLLYQTDQCLKIKHNEEEVNQRRMWEEFEETEIDDDDDIQANQARDMQRTRSDRQTVFEFRIWHNWNYIFWVALGQVFLLVVRFSPVNIIPPLLHIQSCIIWGMYNGPNRGRSSTET